MESTRDDLKVTAPFDDHGRRGGVIGSLAVFFAYHVFWPAGVEGSVDWVSVAIALAAAVALLRYKVGVTYVIAGCAWMGWLLKTLTL